MSKKYNSQETSERITTLAKKLDQQTTWIGLLDVLKSQADTPVFLFEVARNARVCTDARIATALASVCSRLLLGPQQLWLDELAAGPSRSPLSVSAVSNTQSVAQLDRVLRALGDHVLHVATTGRSPSEPDNAAAQWSLIVDSLPALDCFAFLAHLSDPPGSIATASRELVNAALLRGPAEQATLAGRVHHLSALLYCSPFTCDETHIQSLLRFLSSLSSVEEASRLFAHVLLLLRRALLAEHAAMWLLCPLLQRLTEAYARFAVLRQEAPHLWQHFGAECTGIAQLCWQPSSRTHLDHVAALLSERASQHGVVAARLLPLHFAGWLDYALRTVLLDFVHRRGTALSLVLCVLPHTEATADHRHRLYAFCGALAALLRAKTAPAVDPRRRIHTEKVDRQQETEKGSARQETEKAVDSDEEEEQQEGEEEEEEHEEVHEKENEEDGPDDESSSVRIKPVVLWRAVVDGYRWLREHGNTLSYLVDRLLLVAGHEWIPLWKHSFPGLLGDGAAAVRWAFEALDQPSLEDEHRHTSLRIRYSLVRELSRCTALYEDVCAQHRLSRAARSLLEQEEQNRISSMNGS
eukprot:CAMPEP_0174249190 /NCGR_PEP_ID=MMETSP0417-20130205/43454_1 /TAXON_ID=242541 /ORGANISM="Mayorella sp, Strain BSH-02190019" /LENGTH=580 /DNA_ID=CAMNT_0015329059 /DNA_START=25 /DNA_END=1764 /DNA_ORIENTATION=+